MIMADKNSLIADFKALGIKPGMNLLTHSSLRRIGPVDGGADTVIDALLEVLGKDGIEDRHIQHLSAKLSQEEKNAMLAESQRITAWVYEIIKRICTEVHQ